MEDKIFKSVLDELMELMKEKRLSGLKDEEGDEPRGVKSASISIIAKPKPGMEKEEDCEDEDDLAGLLGDDEDEEEPDWIKSLLRGK